ncbi:MAG: hypothetical protein ACHQ3P_08060 [Candidatus Limnocylindrales bacterium]
MAGLLFAAGAAGAFFTGGACFAAAAVDSLAAEARRGRLVGFGAGGVADAFAADFAAGGEAGLAAGDFFDRPP